MVYCQQLREWSAGILQQRDELQEAQQSSQAEVHQTRSEMERLRKEHSVQTRLLTEQAASSQLDADESRSELEDCRQKLHELGEDVEGLLAQVSLAEQQQEYVMGDCSV